MCDDLNATQGDTIQQREAMAAGSLFGFHTPAADPESYDEHGNVRPEAEVNDEQPPGGPSMNTPARMALTALCENMETEKMRTMDVVHPVAKGCAASLRAALGKIDTKD